MGAGKPWRSSPALNEEYLAKLENDIKGFCEESNRVSKAKILMLGPVGAGKSSVITTIDSVFVRRITGKVIGGQSGESLTTKYNEVLIETKMEPLKIYMCDTRGIEKEKPVHEDLQYIIEGNIKGKYVFSDKKIEHASESFNPSPKLEDQIHCVVFVLDAMLAGSTEDYVFKTMTTLQKVLNDKEIPRMVLLTHVDLLLHREGYSLEQVFYCQKVFEVVGKISSKLGIPSGNIMPFACYENECFKLNTAKSCLALQAFNKMVGYARDFLKCQVN